MKKEGNLPLFSSTKTTYDSDCYQTAVISRKRQRNQETTVEIRNESNKTIYKNTLENTVERFKDPYTTVGTTHTQNPIPPLYRSIHSCTEGLRRKVRSQGKKILYL
jgi:hypothetical protein